MEDELKNIYLRLKEIREKYPELRIGQIISNAIHNEIGIDDIFYVTDKKLLESLEKFKLK